MSKHVTFVIVCAFAVLFGAQSVAQWAPTGPENAKVESFAVAPTGGVARLYAATGSGVYVSSDSGRKWTRTPLTEAAAFVTALDDGHGGSVLFASTANGGFRSSDAGSTWVKLGRGMNCLVRKGGALFAGAGGGVYRSTNEGATWVTLNSRITSSIVSDIKVIANRLFIATNMGIYRAIDDSVDWDWCNTSTMIRSASALTAIADASGRIMIFAATDVGVIVSRDTGASWKKTSLVGAKTRLISTPNSKGGVTLLACGGGIHASVDSGFLWTLENSLLTGVNTISIATLPRADGGYKLFAGTEYDGVSMRDSDNPQWSKRNTGFINSFVEKLACGTDLNGNTVLLAYTTRCGGYESSDGARTWSPSPQVASSDRLLDFIAVDSVRVVSTLTGVFRSMNAGAAWDTLKGPSKYWNPTVLALVPDGAGGRTLFAADHDNGLLRSSDYGTSMEKCSGWSSTQSITGIVATTDAAGAVRIFASVQFGSRMGVYLSTDLGNTWTLRNDGLMNPAVQTLAVATDWGGRPHVYAGAFDGVYHSSDEGLNWEQVLSEHWTHQSFAVYHQSVFFGCDSGVFLSTDNGAAWTRVDGGMTDRSITGVAVGRDAAGVPMLFAGTAQSGVWRRPLSDVVSGVERTPAAVEPVFTLQQNHPNPVRARTEIPFTLFRAGPVTLRVCDALGREVTTLLNQEMHPGAHSVPWDASAYRAGVYRYTLEAAGRSETKTALLIR